MSRKTIKLIWSAPLMAVLAVAGALAIFAAVTPGGLLAHGLPGVVTNLTAEADGTRSIDLSWDAPAGGGVDSYRIDRSDDGNAWVTHVTSQSGTSYKDPGLKPGASYYYRAFAVNSAGTGPVSQDLVMQTDYPSDPGTIRALSARAIDQNNIVLNWQPPASDGGGMPITGYRIVVGDDATVNGANANDDDDAAAGTPDNLAANTGNDATTYSHKKLTAKTTKYYVVYAINAVGPSEELSNVGHATTGAARRPDSPTGVLAVPAGPRRQPLATTTCIGYANPANNGGIDIALDRVDVHR